ncbi:hypothetical protein DFH08DRAFT_833052, partial [Mycena albidolilacea]
MQFALIARLAIVGVSVCHGPRAQILPLAAVHVADAYVTTCSIFLGDIPTFHISNAVGAVATRHLYRSPFDNRLRWAEGSSYYGIPLNLHPHGNPGVPPISYIAENPDEMPGWVIGKENARVRGCLL